MREPPKIEGPRPGAVMAPDFRRFVRELNDALAWIAEAVETVERASRGGDEGDG